MEQYYNLNNYITNKYLWIAILAVAFIGGYSCASTDATQENRSAATAEAERPTPDPRIGLDAGVFDAEEAIWNLKLLSTTPPAPDFVGSTSSDLAFKDNYAIQGNYNGFMVWDISNPEEPELVIDFLCPASQSDVSVYQNLLFVSGEGLGGRLDCGTEGVQEPVSEERLRGIRIFDISDIENPEYISDVQTCRGSHTHSVLVDPDDEENVYVYVSGSAPVRPEEELPGCSGALPDEDPNSALFRIEVIQVPLANPAESAIVNSPRIFEDLTAPPTHGLAPEELARVERAKEEGGIVAEYNGVPRVLSDRLIERFLAQIVEERGGSGEPTEADSTVLRENASDMFAALIGARGFGDDAGPNQCHDITLYPEAGLAGGACEGYGLLLDIEDPVRPVRIDAVADSNFAYWHSATFNNEGTTVLFTDEWGGGSQPKCRATDPYEWGANAIYTIGENGAMEFQSYFKMPAQQTNTENCVAHNGSLIPIPGRDIMVQSWYQGGINVFDFTDPNNPVEIAFHDRGPMSEDRLETGGSWSIYWYNGYLINSEISRGLDIFELVPSEFLTENEIAAANTVKLDYLNPQGQPKFEWPATFSLAYAYLDQLERNDEVDKEYLGNMRQQLLQAENSSEENREVVLSRLSADIDDMLDTSSNREKMAELNKTIRNLANNGEQLATNP